MRILRQTKVNRWATFVCSFQMKFLRVFFLLAASNLRFVLHPPITSVPKVRGVSFGSYSAPLCISGRWLIANWHCYGAGHVHSGDGEMPYEIGTIATTEFHTKPSSPLHLLVGVSFVLICYWRTGRSQMTAVDPDTAARWRWRWWRNWVFEHTLWPSHGIPSAACVEKSIVKDSEVS